MLGKLEDCNRFSHDLYSKDVSVVATIKDGLIPPPNTCFGVLRGIERWYVPNPYLATKTVIIVSIHDTINVECPSAGGRQSMGLSLETAIVIDVKRSPDA